MESEVVVTVYIEKLQEKEIEIKNEDIDIENINFMDSLEYEILTPQSKFIIKGRQVYLDNINISSLTPHIDVNGLQEGTHTLQLKMASHPQVEFIQVPNVEVKVFKTEVKESQNLWRII